MTFRGAFSFTIFDALMPDTARFCSFAREPPRSPRFAGECCGSGEEFLDMSFVERSDEYLDSFLADGDAHLTLHLALGPG